MTVKTYPIRVCTDCIAALAYGEPFPDGEEERHARLCAYEESVSKDGGHVACGGEDAGFSWSACDGCGDTRGGDRHEAFEVYPHGTRRTGL